MLTYRVGLLATAAAAATVASSVTGALLTAGTMGLLSSSGPEAAASLEEMPVQLDPSPSYTPRQVVEIQLGALGANRAWGDDEGLRVTFAFASPENRAMTGPFPRFASMVTRSFGALLNHHGFEIGPVHAEGGEAIVPVRVTAEDGQQHGFVWVLRRQSDAPLAGCWMTDAVYPVPFFRTRI